MMLQTRLASSAALDSPLRYFLIAYVTDYQDATALSFGNISIDYSKIPNCLSNGARLYVSFSHFSTEIRQLFMTRHSQINLHAALGTIGRAWKVSFHRKDGPAPGPSPGDVSGGAFPAIPTDSVATPDARLVSSRFDLAELGARIIPQNNPSF